MLLSARRLVVLVCVALLASCDKKEPAAQSAQPETAATGAAAAQAWPREFAKNGSRVVVYQPQVDAWPDYATLQFRCAVAVSPAGVSEPTYGVASVTANTQVDHDARQVLLSNLQVKLSFPGQPADKAALLSSLAMDLLPNLNGLDVSLDRILACLTANPKPVTVDVNLQPPPMFFSTTPAILVNFMGPPQFKAVKAEGVSDLFFATNTNWAVFMDARTSRYYLLNGTSWLTTADVLAGPWTAATALPASLSALPAGDDWAEVRKNIPGVPAASVPKVFVSTTPAELILTDGDPQFSPLAGTSLLYATNPVQPLFLDAASAQYYYLVAGRWFSAASPTGPWSAASANLPAVFARIPPDSPMGYVLASVPKTREASDAILLASVPHKATVTRSEAKLVVSYVGEPQFAEIKGTPLQFATNTTFQVIKAEGAYYCCYNGVWFKARHATGPWEVCTQVPAVIYTIPVTSPLYNVTYVKVYEATPTTVVVGYTGGYTGAYVAATGALMFGAGMVTGALLANDSWYHCNPCYYSYGCAAHYSYGAGGFYRGATCYGPAGGAGWGAMYHPATGTWTRGAYAYGPHGAVGVRSAYNPFTDTYGRHVGATNGYQSWGHSVVSHDGAWAAGGHVSGPLGTRGWAETSSGKWAEGVHTDRGTNVVRTSGGDVYAGHDGNVYRRNDDGQWQHYDAHGWNNAAYREDLDRDWSNRWRGADLDARADRFHGGGGFRFRR